MSSKDKDTHKFLNQVVKAMGYLNEIRGSTARNILNHLQSVTRRSPRTSIRQNLASEVRRALRMGIESGILIQQAGRYKLETQKSRTSPRTQLKSKKANKSKYKRDEKLKSVRKKRGRSQSSVTTETDNSYASTTSLSQSSDKKLTKIDNSGEHRSNKKKHDQSKIQPQSNGEQKLEEAEVVQPSKSTTSQHRRNRRKRICVENDDDINTEEKDSTNYENEDCCNVKSEKCDDNPEEHKSDC